MPRIPTLDISTTDGLFEITSNAFGTADKETSTQDYRVHTLFKGRVNYMSPRIYNAERDSVMLPKLIRCLECVTGLLDDPGVPVVVPGFVGHGSVQYLNRIVGAASDTVEKKIDTGVQ
ncbi:MAG: hypothetical protein M1834_002090 [Cirrosporium novae-zelandiae]|nr:MAG: hypothetical protein M1834_002090 [Cirrosporium novae-zelandiae]